MSVTDSTGLPSRNAASCAAAIQVFLAVLLVFGGKLEAQTASTPSTTYSFSRDIRPILSGKCFQCHGPDAAAREADLRLDQRAGAIELDAIVPGSPEASEIIARVTTTDSDLRMPPEGDSLTEEQVAQLATWIEDGAEYEKHWSFQAPQGPVLPLVNDSSWPVSELDYFTLGRMEQAGLAPSKKAEPAVLLRRLYLDLIGLPPTVEELDAFEADPSAANYEAIVDTLLQSKHFGEKWAAGWLDLARYADSNGYQHDDLRSMWPYRDWVVEALNRDMPFDQFTIEQLAGDLLPEPTTSQLVATGFNRNVPVNFSGGAKVPEVRANVLHDRVATTGAVWLGLTLECAQCHDHKFDAVSQREYYQLYAYFNKAVPEVAQKSETMFKKLFVGREVVVYESEQDRLRVAELEKTLAAEENLLAQNDADDGGEILILDFEGQDPLKGNQLSHPANTSADRDTPESGGNFAAKTVVKPADKDPGYFGTGFTFAERDLSAVAELSLWIKTDIVGSFNLQVHNADNRTSTFGFSTATTKPGTWTHIKARTDAFEKPAWAKAEADWAEVTKIQLTAYGNGPYGGKYIMLDNIAGRKISERDKRIKRIASLREGIEQLQTSTMVMQDAVQPPDTHMMIRGDYANLGDRVETGVLSSLHAPASELPPNRLGLAKWLVDPANPLTSRVVVNRIWTEIFGRGIVTTPEDFGMQGASPSHPQLLDWLALRFVDQGWSQKRLLKSIVMSATYQQTSTASEARIKHDPANAFYARGPRFRLTAELVRDNLLSVSGLLSRKIGGPMVYPVQPEGLWMEILGVMDTKEYPTSTEIGRHRRGIYTVWRRGNPYPSMINFDASERNVCTAQRDRSNTPLQALTLLNDPAYVEMATKFAEVIWGWQGSDREKVVRAFRTAISRWPTDEEVAILLELRRKRGSWYAVAQTLLNLDETITKS